MTKKSILLFSLLFCTILSFAQTRNVSGIVTDRDIGEPLIGVNVLYGDAKGTTTDINGEFILELEPGDYELTVSYIGFISQIKKITVGDKNVYLSFSLRTVTLDEVEVLGDFARTRETPVAFSNISSAKIEEQLASQDIPLILNSTPGVYATQSGGGDGDSRINIRGFNQRNVGVMLDGIPVNDMENGWVYWSNWFGLDAVMRGTQVQRGLGMSKLSIPSVGGTINITTKGIENKKGISVKQEVGSAGYLRTSLGLTTGKTKNGWGVTFAGSFKRGNGWVDETWTKGWFYFLRVDKELGKHLVSFSVMGAPQEHGQRSYKKRISTYDRDYAEESGMTSGLIDTLEGYGVPVDMGLKYNYNWGYLSRSYITDNDTIYPAAERTSTANNYYHKPMFSLRDFWNVNKKLYISNVLYLSLGSGGGRSFSNSTSIDTATNQVNLQKAYNSNINLIAPYWNTGNKSGDIMRNAVNNHFWLGLLSTFDYQINDAFSLSGGVDLRTYKGEHYREVDDLLGGKYFQDDWNDKNETNNKWNPGTNNKIVGDIIGYHNDALVRWGGLFAQLKYRNGNLTSFVNITGSVSGNKRIDYFLPKTLTIGDSVWNVGYYDTVSYNGTVYDRNSSELEINQTDWKYLPGFTVKGGVNYNLNERMNVFVNIGYLSKAQRFSNIFDYSNELFLEIKNEKVKSIELGYSYVQPRFTLNVNTYYTIWENKPSDKKTYLEDPVNKDIRYTVNINKMNARHMGAEFEFAVRITDDLLFESILSIGDWIWTSKDTALVYNDDGQLVGKIPFDARGLHVGDAAQFQNRESLRWQIKKGLYVSGSFTWFGKHYSEFNPMDYQPDNEYAFDENGEPIQSWKIPSYYMFDFNAGYSWYVKDIGFHIKGSVLNAFNGVYITDAQNNDSYLNPYMTGFNANSASVYMGLGRRFNVSLRISF